MSNIYFEKEGKRITCNSGMNLRKLAKKNGIHIYSGLHNLTNCRGNGLCGSCEVEIVDANQIPQRTRMEEVKLTEKPLERRLACQVIVHGNMTVRTHPAKWRPLPKIEEMPKPEVNETSEPKPDGG